MQSGPFLPKSEHTFRFLKGVSGDVPPRPTPVQNVSEV